MGSRGLDEGRARDGLGTLRRGEGGGGGDLAFGGEAWGGGSSSDGGGALGSWIVGNDKSEKSETNFYPR